MTGSILQSLGLDGRVAIVTGGSRGLGREMARSLALAGADVCIASRTESQLQEAANLLGEQTGRQVHTVPTNVQSGEQCRALIERTIDHFGRLDIMVNNAGIGEGRDFGQGIYTLPDEDWHDVMEVNLYSAFYCSKAAVAHMVERGGGGAIVNIGTFASLRGAPYSMAYAAAKAGVISLTKSFAAGLAREGIRVNCIVPGFINKEPGDADGESVRGGPRMDHITAGRKGHAWELGPLCAWLVSDAASYVTGESFVIDGGDIAGGISPSGFAPEFNAGAVA